MKDDSNARVDKGMNDFDGRLRNVALNVIAHQELHEIHGLSGDVSGTDPQDHETALSVAVMLKSRMEAAEKRAAELEAERNAAEERITELEAELKESRASDYNTSPPVVRPGHCAKQKLHRKCSSYSKYTNNVKGCHSIYTT